MNLDAVYQLTGSRVRELRELRGLRQADLADCVGVSRPSIVQFESGMQHLPLETIYAIAAALGAQISDILPRMEELTPEWGSIFQRLEADKALQPESREALREFFEREMERQ